MAALASPYKTTPIFVAIVSVIVGVATARATCSYASSTVKESPGNVALAGVRVFVTDDQENADITRTGDALYSITIKDRGIPFALEFRKDNYQPAWLTGQRCSGKMDKLEITFMAKQSQLGSLQADELMRIVQNYESALDFAKRYEQNEMASRVKRALIDIESLLNKAGHPPYQILQQIKRLQRL